MPQPYLETDRMLVKRLVLGPLENNCFVLRCLETDTAVVIDAAAQPDSIAEALAGMTPAAILITHGHADHIGAVQPLRERFEIPVRLHPADAVLTGWHPDEPLRNGETILVGSLRIDVLHTPGHTPGSVCFSVDGHLFTGDTLFPGGPGATRFPYSDFDQIVESIEARLFTWPDSTPFHPGHGDSSTIGEERPALEIWRQRRW